jgi:hypothetical protein
MRPPTVRLLARLLASALTLMALFQLALAAGAPLGRLAWGGAGGEGVLPERFRIASAAAAGVLGLFAFLALARVGLVARRLPARVPAVAMWVLVAQLALNTLGNAASPSAPERWLMTPITATLAVLALLVARRVDER